MNKYWLLILLLVCVSFPLKAEMAIMIPSPHLYLPDVEEYSDNGVSPDEGAVGSDFNFRVKYGNFFGGRPDYVRVCWGITAPDEQCRNMELAQLVWNPEDRQYQAQAETAAAFSQPGVYKFRFKVRYGGGFASSLPKESTGEYFTFEVTGSSAPAVAFIPGLEGSRLYLNEDGAGNRLWEPNRNADVEKLYLDDNGASINQGIETGEIIDEAFGYNIYKNFISFMDGLAADGDIAGWQALPYDWRMDNAAHVEGMIASLEALAQQHSDSKITVIAHSNGGLIVKEVLLRLQEMKDNGEGDLMGRIERVILVAVPQFGTPQALAGMLHGDELDLAAGFILNKTVARTLGENMASAYGLLPSDGYFLRVADPVIEFTDEVRRHYDFPALYGDNVGSVGEMTVFLTGDSGGRGEPDNGDTDAPNVLDAGLLSAAQAAHNDRLDNWLAPDGVQVTQIAGWGLDTIKSIEYDDCEVCFNPSLSNLDRKLKFTQDGDKTVVAPSAAGMEGERYYLNLYKYNRELLGGRKNREHCNILEVNPLQDLLHRIFSGNEFDLPLHITTEIPAPESDDLRLHIRMHSPVAISAYDGAGNHTGLIDNPDPDSDLKLYEERIPNSGYLEFGGTKYLNLDAGSSEDGYQIRLDGEAFGSFTLEVEAVRGEESADMRVFAGIPVTENTTGELAVSSEGQAGTLALDIDGDGQTDVAVEPGLRMDVSASLQALKIAVEGMGLTEKDAKKLIHHIDQVKKLLEKQESKDADWKIKHMERLINKGMLKDLNSDQEKVFVEIIRKMIENIN